MLVPPQPLRGKAAEGRHETLYFPVRVLKRQPIESVSNDPGL